MKKNIRKNILNISIFLGLIAIALYMNKFSIKSYSRSFLLMDTFVEIELEITGNDGDQILSDAFKLMQNLETKLDYYDKTSKLSEINAQAVADMDKDLFPMLQFADSLNKLSAGLYDISIGELADLWNISAQIIPDSSQINPALNNTGMNKITFDDKTIKKPLAMKLNFGSIAKGYIVDKAVEFLMQSGAKSVIVNAGGDIRILGAKTPKKIGIQHPRGNSGEILDVIKIGNSAVVTSGDYERYFFKNDIRYHHLLNPITGYPANNNISVTVIAPTAMEADAYATAFFVMPTKAACVLAESIDNVELLIVNIIDEKVEIKTTSGMKKFMEKE